ncbi:XdhC family protein [Candidatus Leptofilum sp.]|uniref:XdhC family protein n=1 Tax=Candidatus Leptofilum sp. TaxID=3241576 RepID=UPI003B59FB47
MKEVINEINRWQVDNEAVALATVVQTWGSAPRKVGAKMALTPNGRIAGSVSGGCVEGAVFEEGTAALQTNRAKLLHYGVADETAWDVGLACGGTIEVFVEPLDTAVTQFIYNLIQNKLAGAVITVIRGPEELLGRKLAVSREGERLGSLGPETLDTQAIAAEAKATHPQRVQLGDHIEIFIDAIRPAPTLIIVGGVHIAMALTSFAQTLGYRTLVIDPRRAFGSNERFPHVDQLIQAWPDKAFAEVEIGEDTAVALLTHDPKIDDPALKIILQANPFYIGALGSKKTHAKRVERLRGYGFSDAEIGRIHAPIGLDIAAQTPEEIALAIMAEIVKSRNGN